MTLPDAALQVGLYNALAGDADIALLVGDGVYDHVPADAAFPYIQFGDSQTLSDDAEGLDAAECFVDLHAWSRGPGRMEAKRLAAAMQAVCAGDIALEGHRIVERSSEGVRIFFEADGVTSHVVVSFRYLTEPLI